MKVIIGLVFIAVIVFLVWIIGRGGYQNQTIDPVTTTPAKSFDASTYSDKEIKETSDLYEISVNYPYYNNPIIDDEIKKYIDPARDEFKKAFSSPDEVITAMFGGDNKGFLTIVYEIKHAKNVTTIVFHGSEFTGGAHPTPFIFTVHIGNDGNLVVLSDVFTVNQSEYLGALSRYISPILLNQFKDAFFKEGADTNPENWNHWYIEPGKLGILFTAYQVAPYVNGEPEVIVPFSAIQNIAKASLFE